jgi:hypothetical protein
MLERVAHWAMIVGFVFALGQGIAFACDNDSDCDSGMKCGDDGECHAKKNERPSHKEGTKHHDDDGDEVAHWCCTPQGRFGRYAPNDVLVGQPCHWPTPYGVVVGQACN